MAIKFHLLFQIFSKINKTERKSNGLIIFPQSYSKLPDKTVAYITRSVMMEQTLCVMDTDTVFGDNLH